MEELIGVPSSSRSHFDMNDIQAEAESAKDTRLLFRIHCFNVMISYWRGDFAAAEESSNIASMMYPVSKFPSMHLIYLTFFRGLGMHPTVTCTLLLSFLSLIDFCCGLVLFQCYSEDGGDKRLHDGKEVMNQMGTWAKNSMAVFGNKWLLLKAEYTALVGDKCNAAEELYKKSIKAARDHGIIHELGLAYELLGGYYKMHGRETDCIHCIKQAYTYYTQWGATHVAKKILHDHDLNIESISDTESQLVNSKHPREWQ